MVTNKQLQTIKYTTVPCNSVPLHLQKMGVMSMVIQQNFFLPHETCLILFPYKTHGTILEIWWHWYRYLYIRGLCQIIHWWYLVWYHHQLSASPPSDSDITPRSSVHYLLLITTSSAVRHIYIYRHKGCYIEFSIIFI